MSREGCEAGIAEGMGKCEAEEFRIISSCQVADLAVHFLVVTPFGLNEPSNEALGDDKQSILNAWLGPTSRRKSIVREDRIGYLTIRFSTIQDGC